MTPVSGSVISRVNWLYARLYVAEAWQIGEWSQHMSSRGLAFGGNRINIDSKDLIPLTEILSVVQKKQSLGLSQASPEGIGAFSLT